MAHGRHPGTRHPPGRACSEPRAGPRKSRGRRRTNPLILRQRSRSRMCLGTLSNLLALSPPDKNPSGTHRRGADPITACATRLCKRSSLLCPHGRCDDQEDMPSKLRGWHRPRSPVLCPPGKASATCKPPHRSGQRDKVLGWPCPQSRKCPRGRVCKPQSQARPASESPQGKADKLERRCHWRIVPLGRECNQARTGPGTCPPHIQRRSWRR
mmetsp:Transcript_27121/g.57411  ORF Transcript_27121/g.57411 Transcript_27121/m.57411 type:complete len:212 (-) Transcript_27121:300-935(-)